MSNLLAKTQDFNPTSDDLIYTVNSPAGTPADRKVALSDAIQQAHGLADGMVKIASGLMVPATVGTDYLTAASSNTLTNKTLDSAGTGNVLKVNGTSLTAVTGSGTTAVLATSPTLVTPVLGVATATSVNGTSIPSSGVLARTDVGNTFTGHQTMEGVTATGATGTGKQVYDGTPTLVTPVLGVATATSINGSVVPSSDTLVGRATTDTLTNKTLTSPTVNTPTINTPTVSRWDGWQADSTTWTFASATSFTIAGVDATAYLTKGTKVSWNDATNVPGYGVIASSSFSTNTTVTLITTSDYPIANHAITAPRYSVEATPVGFPTWFNWTPTLLGWGSAGGTNPTNTVNRWTTNGNRIDIVIRQPTAGTSGSASHTASLPVTAATISNMSWQQLCRCTDNGTIQTGNGFVASAGAIASLNGILATNTNTASGSSNVFCLEMFYEF